MNKGAGLNDGNVGASALVLQSDSKIVIGGSFSGVNGSTQANIARLNVDGSLDTSYAIGGTGVDNPVYGDGLDAAGNTLIGGPFNFINGVAHLGIARLKNANGNLDAAYTVNTSYASLIYALTATPGGKVVAGGTFNVVNGIYRPFLARLNADGSLDAPFNSGTGPNDFVSAIVATPDGKTLVGGNFTTMNGAAVGRVARFNVGGMLDTTFNVPGNTDNQVDTLAVQRDGKVVVGGYFQQFDGAQRLRLARLNADGSLDDSFSPAFDNRVASVVIQPDAKILVGGGYRQFQRRGVRRPGPAQPRRHARPGLHPRNPQRSDDFHRVAARRQNSDRRRVHGPPGQQHARQPPRPPEHGRDRGPRLPPRQRLWLR